MTDKTSPSSQDAQPPESPSASAKSEQASADQQVTRDYSELDIPQRPLSSPQVGPTAPAVAAHSERSQDENSDRGPSANEAENRPDGLPASPASPADSAPLQAPTSAEETQDDTGSAPMTAIVAASSQTPTTQTPTTQAPTTQEETLQGMPEASLGTPTSTQFAPPPHSPSARIPRRFGKKEIVSIAVVAVLVGAGAAAGGITLWDSMNPSQSSTLQGNAVPPAVVNNTDKVTDITAAAQKTSPSIVTIAVSSGNARGSGSGIILDKDGNILTNNHVVTLDGKAANPSIQVKLYDGRVGVASVVGTDPLNDLAVIKISKASQMTPATLGDSSKVNVGDTVIAIGTPLQLSLSNTVTDGIISSYNRTITVSSSAVPKGQSDDSTQRKRDPFNFAPPDGSAPSQDGRGTIALDVLQTDAAINPGNSGGALANAQGEVIGVNVAIAGDSGNIGVGFAIPINTAKRISQEIIQTGKASHGQLGVAAQAQAANAGNVPSVMDSPFSVGALLVRVNNDSPAQQAGLKPGDVVTKVDERAIADPDALTAAIREQPAGKEVTITYTRDGASQTTSVTLGSVSS